MPYTAPSRSISRSQTSTPSEHSNSNSTRSQSNKDDRFHKFMNQTNDSFLNSPQTNTMSKFYLLDDTTSAESLESVRSNNGKSRSRSSTSSQRGSLLADDLNMSKFYAKQSVHSDSTQDLVDFTTESIQSYSYTPISNNSLTMRMNVLKRSMEILLENPSWLNSSVEKFPNFDSQSIINSVSQGPKLKDLINSERSVSSSTLQTLIQSTLSSDANFSSSPEIPPDSHFLSRRSNSNASSVSTSSLHINFSDELLKDLKDMLKLLKNYQSDDTDTVLCNDGRESPSKPSSPSSSSKFQKGVLDLHELSLANVDKIPKSASSLEDAGRRDFLKIKLLHALATPFINNQKPSSLSSPTSNVAGIPMLTSTSTLGLSELNDQSYSSSSSKKFHASSNAKTKSPKAVFTVSRDSPWNIMNANDLGLLMFGFSKSSIVKMNLIDLIAPRSRDLVINRLHRDKNLVFSGEIIAVKRNNKSLAWTSLWAKRRDNLIILIFEQVVCETIDMIIERKGAIDNGFHVLEILKQNQRLYHKYLKSECLSSFLPSMDRILQNSLKDTFTDDDITSDHDSNIINSLRYFTLKRENGDYVPCAVTSESLYIDNNEHDVKSYIRVNLHSLPYIAGLFLIDSKDYQIQSFNEAIARNLFGTSDLINQNIDLILPEFSTLMELAIRENPNLVHQEGLVLPEHYFRKLQSFIRGKDDNERENLFLACRGVKGKHLDGHFITVDIQLHVTKNGMFLIWITFCRSFSKNVHKLDMIGLDPKSIIHPNSADSQELLKKAHQYQPHHESHHLNDDTTDSNNLPSQLKLLEHKHRDLDSQGSGTTSNISRSSSLRTLNPNTSSISSPVTPKYDEIRRTADTSPLDAIDVALPLESENFSKVNKSFGMSAQKTCAELLQEEEEELQYLREHSPYFPKIIGAEKRTKKFSDFKILKNLGQGAYGKVVFAQYKKDPLYQDCVKAIFKERILVDTWVRDRTLGTVPSEIQILYSLNKYPHANIMRIVDFFEDQNFYYLETLQHGSKGSGAVDLYDIIEVKKDMTEYEAKYIYFQIVAALTHMHSHGIVHRDIKDENIIVDKDYFVKLIDFGSAAWVKDGPFGVFVGTIDYAAPEVLNGQPYEGKAQDVWAMGVLLYTLVFKENPFCSVDEILDSEVKFPGYPKVSSECMDLIRRILIADVNKRPTMQEIKDDPWLDGFS